MQTKPTSIEKVPILTKKIKKDKSIFDSKNVKKILKIHYPENSSEHYKKLYKIVIVYKDKTDKKREKTLFFGDRARIGCEFIHHGNNVVRDKYLETLKDTENIWDKNFMNKVLLNGEEKSLIDNWNKLKENYNIV
jgi:hypothetical protein